MCLCHRFLSPFSFSCSGLYFVASHFEPIFLHFLMFAVGIYLLSDSNPSFQAFGIKICFLPPTLAIVLSTEIPFDCVDHHKLWKILKDMGIRDHLTCLLRNLYAGQDNSSNCIWNNRLVPNRKRNTSELYIVNLLI